jgi:peptide/nickel transport system substrate-binding protein
LVVAHQSDPAEGLDPHKTIGFPSHRAFELLYTSLVRYNSALEIEPDLATEWDQQDSTTWVFTLREGVLFHNGREFTADDVKYSFERVVDPDTGSPYASVYEPIESIDVVDTYTVRINLKHSYPGLLDNIAMLRGSAIVPREVVEENGDLSLVAVGTGAFKLTSYVPDEAITYVRNDDFYRDGLPYLDGIVYQIITDETSRLAVIRSGAVDFAALGPDTAVRLENSELNVIEVKNWELPQFMMNASRPPFDDPRVREAIQLAVDRNAILNGVAGGQGVLSGPIPTGHAYSLPVEDLPYEVDLDRARALLAEAGYPDGFSTNILTGSLRPTWADFAIIMQSQLAQIGIDSEITILEWGVFLSRAFGEKDFDTRIVTATIQEPSQYTYDYFHSEHRRNRAEFFTGELDELAELTATASSEEERAAAFREMQLALLKDGPIVYSYTPFEYVALQPYVKGFDPIASWRRHALETTWLDQD